MTPRAYTQTAAATIRHICNYFSVWCIFPNAEATALCHGARLGLAMDHDRIVVGERREIQSEGL